MTQRQTARVVLATGQRDLEFQKLSENPNVIITQVVDELSREGQSIRVIDYLEKTAEPVYQMPIC